MIQKLGTYISKETNPYKNLAVEEYLTMHVQEDECILYLWQNRHTVVIGKNQNCWKECRVKELEQDGGQLVRRLSGGGAVYHDLGNLNFTFCVRKANYSVERQLQVILTACEMQGIHAERTGRNDVAAEGRKFSGNAFYESGDFCYHHGTLLLDVDTAEMSRFLQVSKAKLESKGVASVRSRVVNLKELNPEVTVEAMERCMLDAFRQVYGQPDNTAAAALLADERLDWDEIGRLERKFSSWDWKYGQKIPFTHYLETRFPWGSLELELQIDRGVVKAAKVYSDAMEQQWLDGCGDALVGKRYAGETLSEAFCGAIKRQGAGEDVCAEVGEWLLGECL